MNYRKCLVQVDEVLRHINEVDYNKIPFELIDAIKREKDLSYVWIYNEEKSLEEQDLSRQSIALLSYINMEYLCDDNQKEVLMQMHEINQNQKEKMNKVGYLDTLGYIKDVPTHNQSDTEEKALILVKVEEWYKVIFARIKDLFKKK